MSSITELHPPQKINDSVRAMEMARICLIDGRQYVSLSGNLWEDPAAWGLMLVDLAKHVSNAYAQQGREKEEVFQRILAGFRAEIEVATDDPSPVEEP